jgi:hypothetical protein
LATDAASSSPANGKGQNSPDNQALGNEADAYEELLEPIKPLAISDTKEKGRAWLFSLERQWFPCTYEVFSGGPLLLSSKEKVPCGMSGSPVARKRKGYRSRCSRQRQHPQSSSNAQFARLVAQIGVRNMKIKLLIPLLFLAASALADTFRVHYSIRGSGRDITVQAESSAEARRVVMDMFPGAVVTGVSRIK